MQSLSIAEARYQQYLQPPTSESQPLSTKMSVGTMSQSPQISTSAQRGPSNSLLTKLTPEQMRASQVLVRRLREDAAVRLSEFFAFLLHQRHHGWLALISADVEFLCKNVPEQERDTYNSVFEQVSKLVTDFDRTITSYHALFRDENKAKALVNTVSLLLRFLLKCL